MMNQYDMLSRVIGNDGLFGILKEIYAQVDNVESIRPYLGALRRVKDEDPEGGKKSLSPG